jgi:hypothetical protein
VVLDEITVVFTSLSYVQMDNVQGVVSEILTYNVLQKRRLMLHHLGDGLELFLLRSAIQAFPDMFKPLFVTSGCCRPHDVLAILKCGSELEGNHERVASYLIQKLEEPGELNNSVCFIFGFILLCFFRTDGFCAVHHRKSIP